VSDIWWMVLACVLIAEGLLPFVNPALWRKMFMQALQMSDRQLRTMGFIGIFIGLGLIFVFGR
jgi:uncharacterized protein